MTILYHHRTLGDGAEGIHIAEMVKAFRGLGHEVHVSGLAAAGSGGGPGRLARQVKDALPEAAFELAAAASNVAEYWEVRRAITALRPDFLYKRHARFDVGALRAARHSGVPSVLEVNSLFSAGPYEDFEPMTFSGMARRLERRALGLATVVLAVSTPLARQIRSIAALDATVLPNGADPATFDPRRASPERVRARHGLGAALIIGWSGVIREWHGLELLLDTLPSFPDARLLIVGDGPGRAAIEARAHTLGVHNRVVITGRIPHAEMPEHLAGMDIAVVANDKTGVASPMKLLEYMAMGRAAVAPRLDNIADVVSDGIDGVLFEPGDAAALRAAIGRLAADASLRQRIGAAARTTIEQRRNWRHNAEITLDLIAPHTRKPH